VQIVLNAQPWSTHIKNKMVVIRSSVLVENVPKMKDLVASFCILYPLMEHINQERNQIWLCASQLKDTALYPSET
jgi:hypothetical protein